MFSLTGSAPFDLAFGIVTFFALAGHGIKVIRSVLFGRSW